MASRSTASFSTMRRFAFRWSSPVRTSAAGVASRSRCVTWISCRPCSTSRTCRRPRRLDGVSLKPVLEGIQPATSRASYSESAFGRLHFGWSELRALRDGEWKYVEAPDRELYDVRADPGERSNLLPAERAEGRQRCRRRCPPGSSPRPTRRESRVAWIRLRPNGSRRSDTCLARSSLGRPARGETRRPTFASTSDTCRSSPRGWTPCRRARRVVQRGSSSVSPWSFPSVSRFINTWVAHGQPEARTSRRFEASTPRTG